MSAFLGASVFGRFVWSIGSNPVSAHFSGVPVERTIVVAHAISGLMSAVAALVQTSSIAVGSVRFGPELVMNSIAATILGGVVFGRPAEVWGPFFGVLCFALLFCGDDDHGSAGARKADCPGANHCTRRNLLRRSFQIQLSEVSMTKRVMCFGDSRPGDGSLFGGFSHHSFSVHERWTRVWLKLGSAYEIIEEGLSARTTSIDDPVDPR